MTAGRRVAVRCLTALGLAMLAAARVASQTSDDGLTPVTLSVAFTRSSFVGVNEADAMAAFKVFTLRMGEKRGYRITTVIRIYEDLEELAAAVVQDAPRLLIIDSWEYLTLSPGPEMPVVFTTVEQGVVAEDYVMLARSDSGLSELRDLEGRRMVVLESSQANTGRQWLETELMALGVSEPQRFFGAYEIRHKTSQVVLPVFFGTADACVVDRSGFQVMAELNPQVGNELRIVAVSQPMVDTLACVREGGWDNDAQRRDLLAALEELPDDPAGRQIMDLFRFDRLIRFRDEHLDSVRALRQRHEALKAQLAGVP